MYSIEEFENAKFKIMKYITYKKRTEYEVKNKFAQTIETNMLNDIIEYVKEAGYLSDAKYIEKAINEFMVLKSLSIKEVKYKLYSKGLDKNLIDSYIENHQEEMNDYEIKSARKILMRKSKEKNNDEIKIDLLKKGYKNEIISIALEGE